MGRPVLALRGLQIKQREVDSILAWSIDSAGAQSTRGSESGKEDPMKKVRDILDVKGHNIWWISPTASVYDAMKLMAEKGVGALLVMKQERLVGIISERDYARKVILQGRASRTTEVQEIMTSRVLCAEPQQTVEECMALMTEKRFRHLPVIEQDRVIGVISIGDLVKSIIAEQKFIIEQLERYIRS
jgi:signal-transduction protein with cAMP-binding, CBS, and nucleotidyltransferase domain